MPYALRADARQRMAHAMLLMSVMASLLFILLLVISPFLAVFQALGQQVADPPPACSDTVRAADPVLPGQTAIEHRDPRTAAQKLGPVLVCARPS